MPLKKETVGERISRLEEEASQVYYQERHDREDRARDIKIKELETRIAESKINGEVKKVAMTHRWQSVGDILKRLVTLPLLILLFPFLGYALIKGNALPKWFNDLL
jgi:hypothetical protein